MPARPSVSHRTAALALAFGLALSACAASDDGVAEEATSAAQATEVGEPESGSAGDGDTDATDTDTDADADATAATEATPAEESDTADPNLFGEFASLDGTSVNLADYAGQDVVLWFWAPW